jgi:hypothetical protein
MARLTEFHRQHYQIWFFSLGDVLNYENQKFGRFTFCGKRSIVDGKQSISDASKKFVDGFVRVLHIWDE